MFENHAHLPVDLQFEGTYLCGTASWEAKGFQ